MAHEKFHDIGFVIETEPAGEINSRAFVFSEKFGIVAVSIKAGLASYSKLAAHFQPGQKIDFSVIASRGGWQATDASAHFPLFPISNRAGSVAEITIEQKTTDFYYLNLALPILKTIRQLTIFSEPQPEIFSIVDAGLVFAKTKNWSQGRTDFLFRVMMARIFDQLGYLPKTQSILPVLVFPSLFSTEILVQAKEVSRELDRALFQAANASDLSF